jgi:class 3 adenylate cyclase
MEPRIQYAQTEDGVNIAFSTLGEGMPLVQMVMGGYTHLQLEWEIPQIRRVYERLAQNRMLVRYDSRGSGLSDRDVTDYSLEAHLLDLGAVVDRLGSERVALMPSGVPGPVAVAYAVRHPERVSHLVLWCSYARASDLWTSPQVKGLMGLLDSDWELATETSAHSVIGWSEGEASHQFAALVRESVTPEAGKAAWVASSEVDVTALLSEVRSPTLIIHRRQLLFPPMGAARQLASLIPGARLVLLEGDSMWLGSGDLEAAARVIDEFLGEDEEAERKSELPEGMAVILFADIVESTALTEEIGDAAFREKARELDTSLRGVIRECSGTPVEGKLVGDGVLAVFTSARQAIECALRCNGAGESVGLQLHLGIHAGDVIREGNNVYGGAVNIAARIAGASAPGELLVSDTVRGLARTSAGVAFDDRGEHALKGIEDPQRLFAVRGGA